MRRQVAEGATSAGGRPSVDFPIRLHPDDFEIERTEHLDRSRRCSLLDLSLSMPMRDNFLAAKKVAMALQSLIVGPVPPRLPRHRRLRQSRRERSGPSSCPRSRGTSPTAPTCSTRSLLARRLLAREHGTKQIIVITDGEPTAHVLEDGEVFFNYPPVPETVDATLQEVLRCTREGIRINTFVLDATGDLRSFVEQITQLNRGRAFFTTPDTLGDYVLVDFVENRRSLGRRQARGA